MKHEILSESPEISIYNCDNMELMKTFKDNAFDIAIVDPPYGIGSWSSGTGANTITKEQEVDIRLWDAQSPKKEYFDELKRVSKHQIIWGGNYFLDHLGNCYQVIIWDKKNRNMHLADGEMAWCSISGSAVRIYDKHISATEAKGITRIHPTQKPINLYRWLIQKYCKSGDKILDTHLGSGSICLAVHEECKTDGVNLSFVGIEISEKYFDNIVKRFKEHSIQQTLF